MPARSFRPDRLAVAAFAEAAQTLEGQEPQERFARLVESLLPPADGLREPVRWSARGERRRPRVGPPQAWLHLSAHTRGWMTCQRCLEALPVELRIEEQPFRFVESEAVAAELDEEVEEDLLVLSTAFDLHTLIEDELLLTLPWVPRHAQCAGVAGSTVPVRLEAEPDEAAPTEEAVPEPRRPSPFAGLAQLKTLRPAAEAGDSGEPPPNPPPASLPPAASTPNPTPTPRRPPRPR